MENDLVKLAFQPDGVVRIMPIGSIEDISLLPAVLTIFDKELRKQHTHFILDLNELPLLPPSWVVLVYEMTAKARRRGGNVCICNLQETAKTDLYHFQPDLYLCMDETELMPASQGDLFGETRFTGKRAPEGKHKAGPGPEEKITVETEIPSRVDQLYRACDFVLDIASKMGFPETELSKLKISVYEGCLNVIEHAYHSDPTQHVRVQVCYDKTRLVIRIIDHGDGFEVKSGEDFDATAAAAARKTGGMGLHIIRRSMDLVHYVRNRDSGNMLIMEKELPANSSRSAPISSQGSEMSWPG